VTQYYFFYLFHPTNSFYFTYILFYFKSIVFKLIILNILLLLVVIAVWDFFKSGKCVGKYSAKHLQDDEDYLFEVKQQIMTQNSNKNLVVLKWHFKNLSVLVTNNNAKTNFDTPFMRTRLEKRNLLCSDLSALNSYVYKISINN
jgi:hypothetical protein